MTKRKQFSIDEKLSLIKEYDDKKNNGKVNARKFALVHNILPMTLQTILKKRDDLKKKRQRELNRCPENVKNKPY